MEKDQQEKNKQEKGQGKKGRKKTVKGKGSEKSSRLRFTLREIGYRQFILTFLHRRMIRGLPPERESLANPEANTEYTDPFPLSLKHYG